MFIYHCCDPPPPGTQQTSNHTHTHTRATVGWNFAMRKVPAVLTWRASSLFETVNPGGGAQLASCFPAKWSCDPSTCTTANFSLPNGDVVARDQTSSSTTTTSCSASIGTETVFVTPPALASVAAASQSKTCTTKTKREVDMAIVGVSVGMPLSILVIVAWVMVLKEKGLRRRISKDKEEMEGKLRSAQQRGISRKAWPKYELRSDPKSPAIVEWIEKSVSPPSRGGSRIDERRNGRERQRQELRSEPKYPTVAEWYEKSATPVSVGRSKVEAKSMDGRSPKEHSRSNML